MVAEPVRAATETLRPGVLTVIIPVYNERATFIELIESVRAVPIPLDIVIVDDCSTDGTRELLRERVDGSFANVRVLYHETNQGKGMAIRTAIPYAAGEFTIVQDADLEYYPEDYLPMLAGFADPEVTAVYGSRFMNGFPDMRLPNRIVNILLAWMVRVLFRTPMTDEATCYKAFRTRDLQNVRLNCRRFEFCPEVTAKVIRNGGKIVEVPIRYTARTIAAGKKIRWTDGVDAIWTLIKYRFVR
jgi:glycosyltransferase involved in cell wall biosynthesis